MSTATSSRSATILGGDEFTTRVLDAIGPSADAIRTRITERLEVVNSSGVLPAPLAVSVGCLYVSTSNTQPLSELLEAADRDLFPDAHARRAARGAMDSIGRSTQSPEARASAGRTGATWPAQASVLTRVPVLA